MDLEELHIIIVDCFIRLSNEDEPEDEYWFADLMSRHNSFEQSDIKKCESITPEDIAIMNQAEYEDYQQRVADCFNWKLMELFHRNINLKESKNLSEEKVQKLANDLYMFTQSLDEYLAIDKKN